MSPRTSAATVAPRQFPATAFASAEDAWFWTVAALQSRHAGSNSTRRSAERPCYPDDIIRCLDRLYASRRIDLRHVRILRSWGNRGVRPDATRAAERADAELWEQALARLDPPLRMKGIVA